MAASWPISVRRYKLSRLHRRFNVFGQRRNDTDHTGAADDSSFDDILRELALARMIRRGLEDSESGRTLSNDEMKRQMEQCRK